MTKVIFKYSWNCNQGLLCGLVFRVLNTPNAAIFPNAILNGVIVSPKKEWESSEPVDMGEYFTDCIITAVATDG